jgi:FAD:protein FMN transferase
VIEHAQTREFRFAALVIGFILFTTLVACSRSSERASDAAHLVERSRPSMGAEAHLSAWTSDEAAAIAAFEEIFTELERLESLMSVWREGSDIVRLNEAAGRAPVVVSNDVIEALRVAREVGDWTSGGFDVTFGALSDVWKFDHDQDNRIPSTEEIRKRLPLVDYRALTLDVGARTAYLTRKGMRAHLGGIGKGIAVDRAATILRSRAIHDFMIQFGGDLYVGGSRGDRPWRLGIRDPRGPAEKSFAAIDLTDSSFSTSGDYERFFLKNGRRYHHIIDPHSGEPTRGCRSVTIVAENATLADALSTGVFVIGPQAGMALIERLPKVEGVIVTDQNRLLVSSGLKDRLEILSQPTDAP